jgi:hypothetical protein
MESNIDMLRSAVSVLVVAQSISETPEGLMNNPVYVVDHISFPSMENVSGKCIVSNNGENVKAHTSLTYIQYWLKLHYYSHPRSIAHGDICTRLFR